MKLVNSKKYSKQLKMVVLIYIVTVIFYSLLSLLFSSPVHTINDEQLYIAMARSFHYDRNFSVGGVLKDYGSILYSVIISLAYFLYSPRYIIFIMRLLNILISSTVLFPVYLINKELGLEDRYNFFICIIAVIVPEMMNCMFMMQEVLLYPLSMWTFWIIYKDLTCDKISKWTIISAIFMASCYFTKTSALAFFVGYIGLLGINILKKDYIKINKIFVTVLIYSLMLVAEKYFILWCNGGNSSNHYKSQAMHIFPIDYTLIIEIIIGIVFYYFFTLLSMGSGMVNSVLLVKKDGFLNYLKLVLFCLVIEITICILCTENRGNYIPNKLCYRYLFYLFIPFLTYFFKYRKQISIKKYILINWIVTIVLLGSYFYLTEMNVSEGIIDADLFMLFFTVSRFVSKYLGIGIVVILLVIYMTIWLVRNKIDYVRLYSILLAAYCIVFLVINIIQLPIFNNRFVDGKNIASEAVIIEEYIEEIGYEDVVSLVYSEDNYYVLLGTYLKNDVRCVKGYEGNTCLGNELIIIDKSLVNDEVFKLNKLLETDHYILISNEC